jgi:hypothetical protein
LLGYLQIRQKPGLQYDEALAAMGTVHMRTNAGQEFPLPHDPHTWIEVSGNWVPLMTARYVGAVKEYLGLPLFAVFGVRTSLVRVLAMLLGAVGIWGIAVFLRAQIGAAVAVVTAMVLAIHPAYVAMTVFDNGTISVSMAALGLLCVALASYLRRRAGLGAFAVGLAAGFGVWGRVNFAWLLVAMLAAAVLVLRRRILEVPLRHWLLAGAGALVGSLPLILYQIVSGGGTFEAMDMFTAKEPLGERLLIRLIMLSETLLTDREHRAMWNGPAMGWGTRLLLPAVAFAAAVICVRLSRVWGRILVLSFGLLAATLFFSRLLVAEHHLVVLIPFAAAITVMAGFLLLDRVPRTRSALYVLGAIYGVSALVWQAHTVTGLARSGGASVWSDGIVALSERLQKDYTESKLKIKILDWGLQNSIFVLTGGELPTREIYGEATRDRSGLNRPWLEEVREGGVFVFYPPVLRQMPAATEGFLRALGEAAPLFRRFRVPQRDGETYAEAIEVDPETLHQGEGTKAGAADPRVVDRLEGFYAVEGGRWRWAKPSFAVMLDSPLRGTATSARLSLDLYVPDSLMAKVGPVTLSGHIGTHSLAPETFRKTGTCAYTRDLPAGWLQPGRNRFEFAVDKSMRDPAGRDLSVVMAAAQIEAIR